MRKSGIAVHALADLRETACHRNWEIDNWIELVGMMQESFGDITIFSVGLKDSSMHIPNTIDFRGLTTLMLNPIICKTKMMIGPLSPRIGNAIICGCPYFSWATQEYKETWKPSQKCEVRIIDEFGWQPPPRAIFKHFIMYWSSLYGPPITQQ